MINMTQFIQETKKDNIVVVNKCEFKVSDDTATKIMLLIKQELTGEEIEVSQSQPEGKTPVQVTTQVTTGNVGGITKAKTPYVATKDFKPQFEIAEQTGTDGTKLFCIRRKNGWTRAEKSLMNGAIKALKNIKEIEVQYTDKSGKNRTFKAWGYNTESTAKRHLRELPTVFTIDQLNSAFTRQGESK